jgi:hypothetical protein
MLIFIKQNEVLANIWGMRITRAGKPSLTVYRWDLHELYLDAEALVTSNELKLQIAEARKKLSG